MNSKILLQFILGAAVVHTYLSIVVDSLKTPNKPVVKCAWEVLVMILMTVTTGMILAALIQNNMEFFKR